MTKTEQFEARVAAIPDAELAEKCDRELSDLCKTGGDSFLMSIPPGVDDTDILFSELIRRFKNRDKWISVKDQLPEKKKDSNCSIRVLVTDGQRVSTGFHEYYPGEPAHNYWYAHQISGFDVTHWMPLREPPKEGKK